MHSRLWLEFPVSFPSVPFVCPLIVKSSKTAKIIAVLLRFGQALYRVK